MSIDVECEGDLLLRDLPPIPGARAIVAKHLGPDAVFVSSPRVGDAALFTLRGRRCIQVRPRLDREALRWALCHEISEWHLDRLDYRDDDREDVAEALAAVLVTPRPALHRAVRRKGRDLPELAATFVTTQTSVALRLAETRCVEAVAVVRPGLVRVRAPDGFVMPSEKVLKDAAETEGPLPLERHVLTDARRRVAFVAA